MTILLNELRAAMATYVSTKVTLTVAIRPTTGNTINPNELFDIALTARNADAAGGGIPLKNVVWHVWVDNPAAALLLVPALDSSSAGAFAKPTPAFGPGPLGALPQGAPAAEFYLFPSSAPTGESDLASYLGVGDTDTIKLRGKAGGSATGGLVNVKCNLLVDPDLDWLFPKGQTTAAGQRLVVIGG